MPNGCRGCPDGEIADHTDIAPAAPNVKPGNYSSATSAGVGTSARELS